MSLVGTRPPTVDEWDKYELHHRARLATKPGLTGMWQVSGRSNITDLFLRMKIISYIKMCFMQSMRWKIWDMFSDAYIGSDPFTLIT